MICPSTESDSGALEGAPCNHAAPGDVVEEQSYEKESEELFQTLGISDDEKSEICRLLAEPVESLNSLVKNEKEEIQFASVNQLILHMAYANPGSDVNSVFFAAIDFFSSTQYVMAAMFYLFLMVCNVQVRLNIAEVLRCWFTSPDRRFSSDQTKVIHQFSEIVAKSGTAAAVKQKVQLSTGALGRQRQISLFRAAPMILPKGNPLAWTIMMIPEEELSRQITIHHARLFQTVRISDFAKGRPEGAVNELLEHAQSLSNYVTMSVIMPDKSKKRAEVYLRWAGVAQHLMGMSSFNAMFGIYSGLVHPAVTRMAKTTKAIQKKLKKDTKLRDTLQMLGAAYEDQNRYRYLLSNAPNACVPWIESLTKDVLGTLSQGQVLVDGLVNFALCRSLIKQMETFKRFQTQKSRYAFAPHERIQELITNLPNLVESERLLALSEAKEADAKKKKK